MILVGVVGLAVAVAGVWYINKLGESRAIDRALSASDARGYETGAGQQINVTLDDGTLVRVGPESRLTVPKRFGMTGGFRAVKIDGTANFNVTKALKQPFEVRNGQVALIARGTEFTVRRYRDDPILVVHVREGTVDLRLGEEVRSVSKGMSYAVTSSGQMRVPTAEELDEARTWADGNVTIVGHTLRYVLPQLKRWYGLNISVPDTKLLDRKVFVRAAVNSPKEAISSVEQSGGLKFTYIGENMAFQDTVAGTTPAPKTKAAARRR
jgi:ferric-dicitrate binding protein FerR (iron transport regulator)